MLRRGIPVNPKLLGVAILIVFAMATGVAYTALRGIPAYPYTYAWASFATVSHVRRYDDVRVHSTRVGQVEQITYHGHVAHVLMQLPPGFHVYRNARADIGNQSALGREFVNLSPGTPAAGPLGTGGIPVSRTTTPVEIDQVLSILQPRQRQALAATIQTLGAGVGGRGRDLNDLLAASPTLVPDLGTTTHTLAAPGTRLDNLLATTNLLAGRFTGRTAELSALVGQLDTTMRDLGVHQGGPLAATIKEAPATLATARPALARLSAVAATTKAAVATLRPGLAATGAATPDLRGLLREGIGPLDRVPGVSAEAVPALGRLSVTAHDAQHPVAPYLRQFLTRADPTLTYLVPYSPDMTALWDHLSSALSYGDANGNWLRLGGATSPRTAAGSAPAAGRTECRDAYPAPGQAARDRGTPQGGC